MAFRVDLSADAEREAEDIFDWLISAQAGESGLRWYSGMREAIASLSSFPARCSLAPESRTLRYEVRQLIYGSVHRYRILFTIENNVVRVLHIRHGRRERLQ